MESSGTETVANLGARIRGKFAQMSRSDIARVVLFILAARLLLGCLGYLWLAATPTPETVKETKAFSTTPLDKEVDAFRTGDVGWYLDIAEHGYADRPFTADRQENWAFFPLFPIVWRAVSSVAPNEMASGILLSSLFFLLAMVLLYRLLAPDVGHRAAFLTVVIMTVFPASYYATRPGPEALFLLLSIGAFLCARNEHWLATGALGALAALTRPYGLLLIVPLGYMAYRQTRRNARFDVTVLSLTLLPIALVAFMAYLFKLTGNAFAWLDIQRAWGTGVTWPFNGLVAFFSSPSVLDWWGWNLTPISVVATLGAIALVLVAWRCPKVNREYAIWASINVIVLISRDVTEAAPRLILTVFPLMLVAALLLEKRATARTFFIFLCGALQIFFFLALLQGTFWALT
jgi:Gpi18-like mannosyltransferase